MANAIKDEWIDFNPNDEWETVDSVREEPIRTISSPGFVDPTDPLATKPIVPLLEKNPLHSRLYGAAIRGSEKVGQAFVGAPANAVRQVGFLRQAGIAERILSETDPEAKKQWTKLLSDSEQAFNKTAKFLEKPVELHKMGQRVIESKHPEWASEPPKSFTDLLSSPDKLGVAIAESLPVLAGAGILTVAGQPELAVGMMYVTEGESAKEEALASGASEEEAAIAYGIYGSIAAALENMQLQGLIKIGKESYKTILNRAVQKVAGKGLIKSLAAKFVPTAIEEAIEEMAQGSWQEITAKIVYDKEISGGIGDFIDRRAQEAYIAGMTSLIPGIAGGVAGTKISTKPVVGTETPVEAPQIVYHATTKKFEGLPIKPEKGTGKVIFEGEPSGIYYSRSEIEAKQATGMGEKQRIISGRVDAKNTYVVDDNNIDKYNKLYYDTARELRNEKIKEYESMPPTEKKWISEDSLYQINIEDWITLNYAEYDVAERFNKKLQSMGYDSVYRVKNGDFIALTEDVIKPIKSTEKETLSVPEREVEQKPKLPTLSKRALLAKGHKIAKEKGISKEDYRDYAEIVTGKRSMKDMTNTERHQFVQALEESFGSPTELTEADFKKPIVVNKQSTTMDEVFGKSLEAVQELPSKRKEVPVIKKGTYRTGMGTKLKHFFFGIDNTPVYHLANILDGGTEGIFSDVLDKNIQIGNKTSMGHRRVTHGTLLNQLTENGVTPDDLAKVSKYANPRLSLIQKIASKTRTDAIVREFNGKKYEMTNADLVDIYMATKQEDGLRHVTNGGLVINDVRTGPISEDQILSIWEEVDNNPVLKAVVDSIYFIGDNVWKPSLNQVSNRLDGKDIATVPNWWGLEVYMPKKLVGKQETISKKVPQLNLIEDKSILRDRTKSNAPLIVRDALARFSTFEQAISEYVGMAEPTRISRTLLNDVRVRTLLDQKGYNEVVDRITEIHKRAQSITNPEGSFSQMIQSNLSGLYRAVLVANPKVIASQATSAFNYGAYVSPEFITGLKGMVDVDLAKATLAISDVAWDRFFMGHSSLELGEAAKSDATLRFWTDKTSDANKLGWAIKTSDLMALSGGMQIAMDEYDAAVANKLKGFSAEWWIDKTDLPEVNYETWKKVQELGEQATPEDRQAIEIWRSTVTERAEYLWQRTQPSWDKWNRSNLTSQKGLRNVFLLFRSFHEKSLTILNQAKLRYDNSPKTIQDKIDFSRRAGAVMASYTANMILRAMIVAGMTFKIKDIEDYFKDFITSWTGLIPVFGRVLDSSIRNFINAIDNTRHEYRGEPLESLPIEVINQLLKTPENFTSAAGNIIEGDNEAAKEDLEKGMKNLIESLGLLEGIPVYEIEKILPESEEDTTTKRGTRSTKRQLRRRKR